MLKILMSVLTIPMTVTSVPSVLTLRVVLSVTADQGYGEMGEFVQVIINLLKLFVNECLHLSHMVHNSV